MHRSERDRSARRDFLLCAGAMLASTFTRAQAARVYRVAWVLTTSPVAELAGPDPVHPITRAFVHEMRALGYAEGRNLVLERRSAEGQAARIAPILAELRRLAPDVIVMAGHAALNRLAKDTIRNIPIVIFAMSAPVKSGLVASLARPGGNITGLTVNVGPEIEAKRLQLLKEAIPHAVRIVYLGTRQAWDSRIGHAVREVAAGLNVNLLHANHDPTALDITFANVIDLRPDALFASLSAETYGQRDQIVEFARRAHLPGIYPYLGMAAHGGLLAYGVDVVDLGRRAAHYVDKILKGANPGRLAIERPTKFDLVVNLKNARELGLEFPPSILLRADRTIK